MNSKQEHTHETTKNLVCEGCGATLKFTPNTDSLSCEYCGFSNKIKIELNDIHHATQEIDFYDALRNGLAHADKHEIVTVACRGCGTQSTLKPNITSDECAFCGTSLVVKETSRSSLVKPKALLPFKIDSKSAHQRFEKWIHGLWFAPNKLKKYAKLNEKLKGMYIPYWTYDSNTLTTYTGERGEDYTVEEHYTDSDGNTQTHYTTHTNWYPTSGHIQNFFNDILVPATNSLPRHYVNKLEPWDLDNLTAFDEKFLSGFQTEAYQVGLENGFGLAKNKMEQTIRMLIRRDIGGDRQRIHSLNTNFDAITFKHILLPLWISAYRYKDKVYRFLINARTGEVKGERPYSAFKITLAVLFALALVALIVFLTSENNY